MIGFEWLLRNGPVAGRVADERKDALELSVTNRSVHPEDDLVPRLDIDRRGAPSVHGAARDGRERQQRSHDDLYHPKVPLCGARMDLVRGWWCTCGSDEAVGSTWRCTLGLGVDDHLHWIVEARSLRRSRWYPPRQNWWKVELWRDVCVRPRLRSRGSSSEVNA